MCFNLHVQKAQKDYTGTNVALLKFLFYRLSPLLATYFTMITIFEYTTTREIIHCGRHSPRTKIMLMLNVEPNTGN